MSKPKICSCPDWQANMPQLESALLGFTHGWQAQRTPFRFCPWCGRKLTSEPSSRDKALIEKYHQLIVDNFNPTGDWGVPQEPNMFVAARPIKDYQELIGDILGTLEL